MRAERSRGRRRLRVQRCRPGRIRAGRAWLALVVLCLGTPAVAQPRNGAAINRDLQAVRFSAPPVVDGDLSDECWKQAPRAEEFIDEYTGRPTAEGTVAWLGYDDRSLYVAFQAFDSQPDKIVARETKRGTFPQGDDWLILNLDPFHTHKMEDLCIFVVNPRGTQQAKLGGGRATKLEWEGDWKAAARIGTEGWTAEMAIPWSILNYPATRGATTCGLNFLRCQKRLDIVSDWSHIGPDNVHLEQAGHLVGVEFPPFRPRFSLLPYSSPGWALGRGFMQRTGLDLRYALSPSLTAVGTVNPDFATVEEAVEGIDFSYGERFVPDRRPFFAEGGDFYGTGAIMGDFFHSRRIPDFDLGTKLYGKLTERDSLGVLAALDLGHRADWMVRGRHEFGPTSNVNLAFVNRDTAGLSNRVLVLGEDFRRGDWNANASYASSWVNGRKAGEAGCAFLFYGGPKASGGIVPHFITPGFRDELGFIPFMDHKGVAYGANYHDEPRKGPLKGYHLGAGGTLTHHYNGKVFNRMNDASFGFTTRSDIGLHCGWSGGRFEDFRDSLFNVDLRLRDSDPFHNFGVSCSWGRQAGARKTFVAPSFTWRFGERLTLGLASAFLNHTEDRMQNILTLNYDFTPRVGLAGRIVAQTGGTGGYLAFRRSGYGGTETWLILGDPNASRFTQKLVSKVVWPL